MSILRKICTPLGSIWWDVIAAFLNKYVHDIKYLLLASYPVCSYADGSLDVFAIIKTG